MTNSTSSKNYAGALAQIAKSNSMSFDEIKNDLNVVASIIGSSIELKDVLGNVTLSTDIKSEIINDVFKNQVNPKIINFLKIITDKNKFNDLAEIKAEFEKLYNEEKNIKTVEITSAIQLTDVQKNRVIEKLQNKLHKEIAANWLIDENIIGGLIIKIDDDVINSSLKNKLEKIV